MYTSDRRLIEDLIPIREVSEQAASEKSGRQGNISTMHMWWARRPLIAARAAVYGTLIPAPITAEERQTRKEFMVKLCRKDVAHAVLEQARQDNLQANNGQPPRVLDIFAGGGSIPLEALRLGCEAYAIDLNPVAHVIELCTLVYPQKYGRSLIADVKNGENGLSIRPKSNSLNFIPH